MDFAAVVYAAAGRVPGMLTTAVVTLPGWPLDPVPVGFSEPSQVMLGGEVLADAPAITYPASALPVLPRGTSVVVAGRSWRIKTVERIGDGGECRATLERA